MNGSCINSQLVLLLDEWLMVPHSVASSKNVTFLFQSYSRGVPVDAANSNNKPPSRDKLLAFAIFVSVGEIHLTANAVLLLYMTYEVYTNSLS